MRRRLLFYPPLCRNRNVVPGRAWATEGRWWGIDHSDHRVATGDRVIGEHHDRLAVGRHLDGPFDQALAGELAVVAPLECRAAEADPDAIGRGADDERGARQRRPGSFGEPVAAWPLPELQRGRQGRSDR